MRKTEKRTDRDEVIEAGWIYLKDNVEPGSQEYHQMMQDLCRAEEIIDKQENEKKRINVEMVAAAIGGATAVYNGVVALCKIFIAFDKENNGHAIAGWRAKLF